MFYTFDPHFGFHFWYPKMGANFGAKKSQEACLRSGHGKELELEGIDQDRTNLKQDGWETFFTSTPQPPFTLAFSSAMCCGTECRT